jgi:phosphatidylglycerol---prolipoprotein diacylglyceryl transferase
MTVYPLKFMLGPIEITGYGLMMMVGFVVAGWTIRMQLLERKLNPEYADGIVLFAVAGGIIGAKLWYVAITPGAPVFSRGGLVWYGGFIGGFLAVMFYGIFRKVPTRMTMDLTAPAICAGYLLGRVGCFLVQDDYGFPTSLPWGMKFPQGLPPTTAFNLNQSFGVPIPPGVSPNEVLAVHPTQLYEVTLMLVVFAVLWRFRNHLHGAGWLMGLYLMFAGVERFLIEFLRAKDDRIFGPFTIAQATSIGLILIGVTFMTLWSRRGEMQIPKDSALVAPPPASAA